MKIPFNEVRIGQKLRFFTGDTATIYTRVAVDGKPPSKDTGNPRTLTYEVDGKIYDAYCGEDSARPVTVVETPSKVFSGLTVEQLINQLSKIKNKKMPVLLSANEIKPAPDTVQVMQGQECVLLCDRVRESGRGFKVVK